MTLLLLALLGCRQSMTPDVQAPRREPRAAYEGLLQQVITPDGYVDYDVLEANREPLDLYVGWLGRSGTIPGGYRATHAHYLNAYNAFTLFAILEEGRPASVKDIDGWLPLDGSGFFLEREFALGAYDVSLWEIEHELIRGRNMDFRSHAAMNCGASSCPPLRDALYTNDKLNKQLDDQMRLWVNDPERGMRVEDGQLVVNPIFEWFEHDFVTWSGGKTVCEAVLPFARGGLRRELTDRREDCPLRSFEYDWSLNHRQK